MYKTKLINAGTIVTIIVTVLIIALFKSLFAQSTVPYRIRMPDSTYSAKLVGNNSTRTADIEVTGTYSSTFRAHQFNVTVGGRYYLYYDPLGGSNWVIDNSWSGSNGKAIYTDYFMDQIDTDFDNEVDAVDDSTISLAKMTTAAINYINAAGGGSITNNPDDISLENKAGSTIGVKHQFLTDSIFTPLDSTKFDAGELSPTNIYSSTSYRVFLTAPTGNLFSKIDSSYITNWSISPVTDIRGSWGSDHKALLSHTNTVFYGKIDSTYIKDGSINPALDLTNDGGNMDGAGLTLDSYTLGTSSTGLNVNVDAGLSIDEEDSINVNVDGSKIVLTNDTLTVGNIDSTDIPTGGLSWYDMYIPESQSPVVIPRYTASGWDYGKIDSTYITNGTIDSDDLWSSSMGLDGDGLTLLTGATFGQTNTGLNVNVDGTTIAISSDTLGVAGIDSIVYYESEADADTLRFWVGSKEFRIIETVP